MKLVVQRVSRASVSVENKVISEIGIGLLVLVGIHVDDDVKKAEILADKLIKLRVMGDEDGKMNLSVPDVNGSVLVVSQFTLYGDTKGGNRPSFIKAARPEIARPIYEHFVKKLKQNGIMVKTGEFGTDMKINVMLDGPVSIIIEN